MIHCFPRLVIVLLILLAAGAQADRRQALNDAALERLQHKVTYNGAYFRIAYPMGDVPAEYGVCTDEVIRSYRQLGIDLQQLVHEDMRANFSRYPAKRIWNQESTDRNIDHRRVPNLETFFRRHGQTLPISREGRDYQPGEIITWILPGNLPHIGIVVDRYSHDGERPLILHNIGRGPELDDVLFRYTMTGRFTYGLDVVD